MGDKVQKKEDCVSESLLQDLRRMFGGIKVNENWRK